MKNQTYRLSIALTLLLIPLGCAERSVQGLKERPIYQEQPPPLIEIEIDRKFKLSDRLAFKWRVVNNGPVSVFLFSSLLDPANAAFAEFEINGEQKTIQVGFLRSKASSGFPPYSFPKIQFKELAPGQSLEGSFESDQSIDKFDLYGVKGDQLQKMKVDSGSWSVRTAVAWGSEIESVRRALQTSGKEGQEHPVNPITRWQKVADSAPIVITVEK